MPRRKTPKFDVGEVAGAAPTVAVWIVFIVIMMAFANGFTAAPDPDKWLYTCVAWNGYSETERLTFVTGWLQGVVAAKQSNVRRGIVKAMATRPQSRRCRYRNECRVQKAGKPR